MSARDKGANTARSTAPGVCECHFPCEYWQKPSLSLPIEAARTSSGYQVSQGNGEQDQSIKMLSSNPTLGSNDIIGAFVLYNGVEVTVRLKKTGCAERSNSWFDQQLSVSS